MATTETLLYGTDVAFKADFAVTPIGDLDRVSGLANLKEAILRRVFTSPGSIIHRPDFGVGLKNYLNGINSVSRQQALAIRLQDQLEQDPRVDTFLGLRVETSASNPGLVKIFVRIKPVGYDELTVGLTTQGI